jgi:FkbM family methyltransferase
VEQLCGQPYQLAIAVADLRAALRYAYEHRDEVKRRGLAASADAHDRFTWKQTAARMAERIKRVAHQMTWQDRVTLSSVASLVPQDTPASLLAVVVHARGDASTLPDCLARVRPFVDKLLVTGESGEDRARDIAQEYAAQWLTPQEIAEGPGYLHADWVLTLDGDQLLSEVTMLALPAQLANQPSAINKVAVSVVRRAAHGQPVENGEVRVVRNRIPNQMRDGRITRRNAPSVSASQSSNGHAIKNSVPSPSPLRTNEATPPMLEPWLVPYVPTSGDLFLDIGANVGTWTRWLAASYREVHAIEPNPDVLPALRHGLPDNVVVHEFGAWDAETTISFSRFSQSVHLTAYFHEEGINTGPKRDELTLPCRTVDSLALTDRVDFIKCDTEGAELHCLRGARQTIARDRPWLLIECHSTENCAALSQLLTAWYYLFTIVRDPHYEPFSANWYAHCWFSCQPRVI